MRKILLILLILSIGYIPASAQNVDEWSYGWDNDSGVLAAYNYVGGFTSLLTINPDVQPLAWRLDNERVLAWLAVEDGNNLYELTPTEAIPFTPQLGAELILPSVRRMVARRDPYIVLTAQEGAFEAGLFVNLDTHTVEPLSGESFELIPNWRFSQDGSTLYYLSRIARDTDEWNIWARNLTSGDELSLHDFTSPFPTISVSQFGEQWIYTTLEGDVFSHVAVNADGGTRLADQQTIVGGAAYRAYSLIGSTELRYLAPCSADCSFEQLDLGGTLLAKYNVPTITSPQVTPLAELDASHLLVLVESEYWVLDSTQAGTLLGRYDAVKFLDAPQTALSPDKRWLLTSDGGAGFRLWDLTTYTIAAEGEAGTGFSVNYTENGILLSQFEPSQTILFDFASQTLLPHVGNDFYADVLDDGTVVYVQALETAGRPAGVYRYNVSDGTYILMWQNIFPLLTLN